MKRFIIIAVITGLLGGLMISPALAQSHVPGGDMCPHDPMIAALQDCVSHMEAQGVINNAGVAESLRAKLSAADAAQDRGQSNIASRILSALVLQVKAQSGKHIAEPHASHLGRHIEMVRSSVDS